MIQYQYKKIKSSTPGWHINIADVAKFDCAILKITRRQNLEIQEKSKPLYDSRCDEASVDVACAAAVVLIIALKLLQSPTAA